MRSAQGGGISWSQVILKYSGLILSDQYRLSFPVASLAVPQPLSGPSSRALEQRQHMTNDNGQNNEPTSVLVKLWHTCPKWHVENLLGTRHSLLSQYFISFSRPASLYCEHYVYIHTYLTPYRLYMNYRCYQITMQ